MRHGQKVIPLHPNALTPEKMQDFIRRYVVNPLDSAHRESSVGRRGLSTSHDSAVTPATASKQIITATSPTDDWYDQPFEPSSILHVAAEPEVTTTNSKRLIPRNVPQILPRNDADEAGNISIETDSDLSFVTTRGDSVKRSVQRSSIVQSSSRQSDPSPSFRDSESYKAINLEGDYEPSTIVYADDGEVHAVYHNVTETNYCSDSISPLSISLARFMPTHTLHESVLTGVAMVSETPCSESQEVDITGGHERDDFSPSSIVTISNNDTITVVDSKTASTSDAATPVRASTSDAATPVRVKLDTASLKKSINKRNKGEGKLEASGRVQKSLSMYEKLAKLHATPSPLKINSAPTTRTKRIRVKSSESTPAENHVIQINKQLVHESIDLFPEGTSSLNVVTPSESTNFDDALNSSSSSLGNEDKLGIVASARDEEINTYLMLEAQVFSNMAHSNRQNVAWDEDNSSGTISPSVYYSGSVDSTSHSNGITSGDLTQSSAAIEPVQSYTALSNEYTKNTGIRSMDPVSTAASVSAEEVVASTKEPVRSVESSDVGTTHSQHKASSSMSREVDPVSTAASVSAEEVVASTKEPVRSIESSDVGTTHSQHKASSSTSREVDPVTIAASVKSVFNDGCTNDLLAPNTVPFVNTIARNEVSVDKAVGSSNDYTGLVTASPGNMTDVESVTLSSSKPAVVIVPSIQIDSAPTTTIRDTELLIDIIQTGYKNANQDSLNNPIAVIALAGADKQSPATKSSGTGAHMDEPIKRGLPSDVDNVDRAGGIKINDKIVVDQMGLVAGTESVLLSSTSLSPSISNRDMIVRSDGTSSADVKHKPSWHMYLDKLSDLKRSGDTPPKKNSAPAHSNHRDSTGENNAVFDTPSCAVISPNTSVVHSKIDSSQAIVNPVESIMANTKTTTNNIESIILLSPVSSGMSPVRVDTSLTEPSSATNRDVVASRESTETKHKPSWHMYLDKLSSLRHSKDPNTAVGEIGMDACSRPVDVLTTDVVGSDGNDLIHNILSSESTKTHHDTLSATEDPVAISTMFSTNLFVAGIADPSTLVTESSDAVTTRSDRSSTQTSDTSVNSTIATTRNTCHTDDASPDAVSDPGSILDRSSAVETIFNSADKIAAVSTSNAIYVGKSDKPGALQKASTNDVGMGIPYDEDSSPSEVKSSVADTIVSTNGAGACIVASNNATMRDLTPADVRITSIKSEGTMQPVVDSDSIAHNAIADVSAPSRSSSALRESTTLSSAAATTSTNIDIDIHKSDKLVQSVEYPYVHIASDDVELNASSKPVDTMNTAGNRISITGSRDATLKADDSTPKTTPSWHSYLVQLSGRKISAENMKQDKDETEAPTPPAGIINNSTSTNSHVLPTGPVTVPANAIAESVRLKISAATTPVSMSKRKPSIDDSERRSLLNELRDKEQQLDQEIRNRIVLEARLEETRAFLHILSSRNTGKDEGHRPRSASEEINSLEKSLQGLYLFPDLTSAQGKAASSGTSTKKQQRSRSPSVAKRRQNADLSPVRVTNTGATVPVVSIQLEDSDDENISAVKAATSIGITAIDSISSPKQPPSTRKKSIIAALFGSFLSSSTKPKAVENAASSDHSEETKGSESLFDATAGPSLNPKISLTQQVEASAGNNNDTAQDVQTRSPPSSPDDNLQFSVRMLSSMTRNELSPISHIAFSPTPLKSSVRALPLSFAGDISTDSFSFIQIYFKPFLQAYFCNEYNLHDAPYHKVDEAELVLWTTYQLYGKHDNSIVATSIRLSSIVKAIHDSAATTKQPAGLMKRLCNVTVPLVEQKMRQVPYTEDRRGYSSPTHRSHKDASIYSIFYYDKYKWILRHIIPLVLDKNANTDSAVAMSRYASLLNTLKQHINSTYTMQKKLSYQVVFNQSRVCMCGFVRPQCSVFSGSNNCEHTNNNLTSMLDLSRDRVGSSASITNNKQACRLWGVSITERDIRHMKSHIWDRNYEQVRHIYSFYTDVHEPRHQGSGSNGYLLSYERCREMLHDFDVIPSVVDNHTLSILFQSCKIWEWNMAAIVYTHNNHHQNPVILDAYSSPLPEDMQAFQPVYQDIFDHHDDFNLSVGNFALTLTGFIELLTRIGCNNGKLSAVPAEAMIMLLHVMNGSSGTAKLANATRRSVQVRKFDVTK